MPQPLPDPKEKIAVVLLALLALLMGFQAGRWLEHCTPTPCPPIERSSLDVVELQ